MENVFLEDPFVDKFCTTTHIYNDGTHIVHIRAFSNPRNLKVWFTEDIRDDKCYQGPLYGNGSFGKRKFILFTYGRGRNIR